MYRVVKLTSQIYAIKIKFDEDTDNIKEFINSGDVVILCDRLEDLEKFGIHRNEIELAPASE